MKRLIKSFGMVAAFIGMQIVSVMIVFFVNCMVKPDWIYEISDTLLLYGALSNEYMRALSGLIYPSLMLSDIILIIPFILHSARKKDKMVQKVSGTGVLTLFCISIVLNAVVSYIVSNLPDTMLGSYNTMMSSVISDNLFVMILVTGILAPIAEEFVFRYGIIRLCRGKSEWYGILVSALFFGIAHMNPIQSTYAFVLGVILAYVYTRENNLLKPIFMHIVINTSSVVYEYVNDSTKVYLLGVVMVCFLYTVYYFGKKVCNDYVMCMERTKLNNEFNQ